MKKPWWSSLGSIGWMLIVTGIALLNTHLLSEPSETYLGVTVIVIGAIFFAINTFMSLGNK